MRTKNVENRMAKFYFFFTQSDSPNAQARGFSYRSKYFLPSGNLSPCILRCLFDTIENRIIFTVSTLFGYPLFGRPKCCKKDSSQHGVKWLHMLFRSRYMFNCDILLHACFSITFSYSFLSISNWFLSPYKLQRPFLR